MSILSKILSNLFQNEVGPCIYHVVEASRYGAPGVTSDGTYGNIAAAHRTMRSGPCVALTGKAEAVEDGARRVGEVEDSGHVVIQEVVTLFQGEANADAADHFAIVFATLTMHEESLLSTQSVVILCENGDSAAYARIMPRTRVRGVCLPGTSRSNALAGN